jgi:3-oxoadipate enol-lactonase
VASSYHVGMTTTTIGVPGGRLNVTDDGSGPPILLLHAGIADLRAWDALVPHLVGAGYRAVRYDQRGFGASTTDDVPFSNRADVLAVMDALGIGGAVLVGNSRGGQIAFDTAIEFPDRVVAVVGVGAGLGGFDGGMTPEEATLVEEMDRLESAESPDPDAIADIDVRAWVDGPGQPPTRVAASIRDAVRAMDAPQYAPERVGGQPIPLDPVASERLSDIRAPVLAIAGALDFSDVVATARHLGSGAPDARALIWDDVAHMIGMEVPERLAAAIVEFLAPLPRWS